MGSPLSDLGLTASVLAAPMAGGAGTPALVTAAARAGGLGFLAAGYKTPEALAGQIAAVRAEGVPFGVNVFAPNPVPVDAEAYRRYARAIQSEAEPYGLDLTAGEPVEDDDHWKDKIDLLLADPVPVVSFTFGVPEPAVIAALRAAGSLVAQTVTSAEEARLAEEAGAGLLIVQCSAAGAHSGTLTPERLPPEIPLTELIARVRQVTDLPMVAAGGLATPDDVAGTLRAGAVAAMVGTVLLRTDESGATAAHREALTDPARDRTVVTRAFTGRPARGLRNRFTDRYSDGAPSGYPAVHHLTSPLRKAAAAANDQEVLHLWAGTGHRHATAEPAAQVLTRLASKL
ncbi:nitronate monooxygenase [Actinoallomurus iriomotensis]|uniref:Propionate 3-nitronate monooxygenase n=1 Tax=Actinoallomurus iriomotensis TaxID=478107 RepID=A0A9W6VW05_9ACTN|nr:nitronate monooxygenase [Actinoallomurus iriomotensis]GLY87278.1 oxidoreductase [Actinoallomurus iriomotensis]